jgi:hypothetical protein
MAKNCGHTVPCGCKDTALTTAPPCETTGPCAGEKCAEVFCDECIGHCKDDLIVTIENTDLDIPNGTRLNVIWQRLAIAITDPECAKLAAVGLCITDVTSTSVTIAWVPGTSSQYQIAYDSPTCPSSGTSPELGNSVTTYTLTGLLPGEEYIFEIIPIGNEPCPTIKIKTKTLDP